MLVKILNILHLRYYGSPRYVLRTGAAGCFVVTQTTILYSNGFTNFCPCIRSSHQRCSIKKGVLRNFAKFTGKHMCQSLFFNKVAGLRPATLLKKRLWHRCFPVNFAIFLRTPFLQNTSGRLLLMHFF